MEKTKKINRVLVSLLLTLLLCSVIFGGCAMKGSIDKNFQVIVSGQMLTETNKFRSNVSVSSENGYYSGKITCQINNTSGIDYTNVSIRLAIYDTNRNLITTVEKPIGKIGHAGSSSQDETGASSRDVEITFRVKSSKQYNLNTPFCELLYMAGWKGLGN